jgi:hypothetical protein
MLSLQRRLDEMNASSNSSRPSRLPPAAGAGATSLERSNR